MSNHDTPRGGNLLGWILLPPFVAGIIALIVYVLIWPGMTKRSDTPNVTTIASIA